MNEQIAGYVVVSLLWAFVVVAGYFTVADMLGDDGETDGDD